MRERRESLLRTAVRTLWHEGPESLARAPFWVGRTVMTESSLRLLRRWRRTRYRRNGWQAVPDPTAVIDINPASVEYFAPLSRFDESTPRALLGAVRDGDWDRGLPRIEPRPKYQACRARVEEGTDWEDTPIIDHLVAELEASDADAIEHGCSSRVDIVARYRNERETLYRSLRDHGYDRSKSPVCCRVHVGRNGRLLFGSGGRHRFYLSRLLGIDTVPVQVLCRHQDWQVVREAAAAPDSLDALPDHIRRRLHHPDLQEFTPVRGAETPSLR